MMKLKTLNAQGAGRNLYYRFHNQIRYRYRLAHPHGEKTDLYDHVTLKRSGLIKINDPEFFSAGAIVW